MVPTNDSQGYNCNQLVTHHAIGSGFLRVAPLCNDRFNNDGTNYSLDW